MLFKKLLLLSTLSLAQLGFAQFIADFTPASPFISAISGTNAQRLDGQTFTAANSGVVGLVSVRAQAISTPANVTFQLRTVSSGLPTSTILSSVTVSGAGMSTSALTTFTADFGAQNLLLTAGQSYALTLSAPSMFFLGGVADAYTGGGQVFSANGGTSFSVFAPSRDLWFTIGTAASPVPEPATYSLAAGALLVGLVIHSRRASRTSHK
jgi:hypothetical protein